jgi:hypothetical protein
MRRGVRGVGPGARWRFGGRCCSGGSRAVALGVRRRWTGLGFQHEAGGLDRGIEGKGEERVVRPSVTVDGSNPGIDAMARDRWHA